MDSRNVFCLSRIELTMFGGKIKNLRATKTYKLGCQIIKKKLANLEGEFTLGKGEEYKKAGLLRLKLSSVTKKDSNDTKLFIPYIAYENIDANLLFNIWKREVENREIYFNNNK